tara:strand:+ start:641 stop:895 length:255 start_codon:yes stop_codon:yes gene_type:complete
MKIDIFKAKGCVLIREIEDDTKTWVEGTSTNDNEVGPADLVDFFESCVPPHTGSVVSGSIIEEYDEDGVLKQKCFYGEHYTAGN